MRSPKSKASAPREWVRLSGWGVSATHSQVARRGVSVFNCFFLPSYSSSAAAPFCWRCSRFYGAARLQHARLTLKGKVHGDDDVVARRRCGACVLLAGAGQVSVTVCMGCHCRPAYVCVCVRGTRARGVVYVRERYDPAPRAQRARKSKVDVVMCVLG